MRAGKRRRRGGSSRLRRLCELRAGEGDDSDGEQRRGDATNDECRAPPVIPTELRRCRLYGSLLSWRLSEGGCGSWSQLSGVVWADDGGASGRRSGAAAREGCREFAAGLEPVVGFLGHRCCQRPVHLPEIVTQLAQGRWR